MTNEELNTSLYEKCFAAQEHYREWLLSLPPEEILNHTYEYTIREDILLALETNRRPRCCPPLRRWTMCFMTLSRSRATTWI